MKEIHLKKGNITYKLEKSYIADDRATYYATREHWEEKTPEWEKEYLEEYNYTMEDNGEAYDWMLNSTDPCDFKWNIHVINIAEEQEATSWDDYDEII